MSLGGIASDVEEWMTTLSDQIGETSEVCGTQSNDGPDGFVEQDDKVSISFETSEVFAMALHHTMHSPVER